MGGIRERWYSVWFCFGFFWHGDNFDTASISEQPLMRDANSPTGTNPRCSGCAFSSTLELLNPFTTPVQCTVSAKAPYPMRKDLVNSFAGYDAELPTTANYLHLQFRQGDPICVLGQFGGMLIGYLDYDPNRVIGFLSPALVYVDLASVTQIDPPPKLPQISSPELAYAKKTMSSLPTFPSK
ncbi:hypothetical protein L0F63_002766 [Massospora cicadina]|nr:hypothetical protein L0F63_002766 [Massospora cicadina]